MNTLVDAVTLARELAEIARTTTDVRTGRQLMEVVNRLLTEAGLSPDGGGETPGN
jgi:hypothetical protein